MEEECKKTPIIPQDERTKDVLVLGKTLSVLLLPEWHSAGG